MEMMPQNDGKGATPTEETNRESEPINVPIEKDAEIAVESSHSKTEASDEDDVLHDLRDSFSRTASLGKRPGLRRKNSSSSLSTGRPMAPRRAQSMNAGPLVRSIGRTKSSDLSTMPTLLQQGNPRSILQRPPAPQRTKSGSSSSKNRVKPVRAASDSLRTMRRDQLVNTALERKMSPQSLLRRTPDKSNSVTTFRGDSLESCFTTDSETMRKNQLIADPLDDGGTYYENDSCANHDDSISHFSEYSATPRELNRRDSGESLSEYGDGSEYGGGDGSIATFCTFDSHPRLRRLQIHDGVDQSCDISLYSDHSFTTLNTAADVGDLDNSITDEEEELCGLDDLDEVGESNLGDRGESGLGEIKELNESNASVACVSIEANASNVD
jgi:hypothetical protein